MRKSNYVVIEEDFAGIDPVVIKDVGPWDKYLSVTNDAENVIEELFREGRLNEGQRLFYIDSNGLQDEILIKNRKFAGFARYKL